MPYSLLGCSLRCPQADPPHALTQYLLALVGYPLHFPWGLEGMAERLWLGMLGQNLRFFPLFESQRPSCNAAASLTLSFSRSGSGGTLFPVCVYF